MIDLLESQNLALLQHFDRVIRAGRLVLGETHAPERTGAERRQQLKVVEFVRDLVGGRVLEVGATQRGRGGGGCGRGRGRGRGGIAKCIDDKIT